MANVSQRKMPTTSEAPAVAVYPEAELIEPSSDDSVVLLERSREAVTVVKLAV